MASDESGTAEMTNQTVSLLSPLPPSPRLTQRLRILPTFAGHLFFAPRSTAGTMRQTLRRW